MNSTNGTLVFQNQRQAIFNTSASYVERIFLGIWCALTCTCALMGNTMFLYATSRYNVVKLDKISTTLIKNIAFADIGYSFYIMTTLVSIVENKWVFGEAFCKFIDLYQILFAVSEIYLICALNVNKLYCITFPFLARLRSQRIGYYIAALMWCVVPIFHFLPTAIIGRVQRFKRVYYRCGGFFRGSNKILKTYANVLFLFLPQIIVFVSVVAMLVCARRLRNLQTKSIVTLILISLCYLCSYVPFALFFLAFTFKPDIANNVKVSIQLNRFVLFVPFLNFSANPFIYIFSIKSLQNFLVRSMSSVGTRVMGSSERTHMQFPQSDQLVFAPGCAQESSSFRTTNLVQPTSSQLLDKTIIQNKSSIGSPLPLDKSIVSPILKKKSTVEMTVLKLGV